MDASYNKALQWVLDHEGGFVDHPADPGGATNMGVTQAVYDGFRRRKRLATRSVRQITQGEVWEIYRDQYWKAVRAGDLPTGLDYAVFDFAVNSGSRRAAEFLQRALGVPADGVIGSVTLAAAQDADAAVVIGRLCDDRLAWLKRLRHWPTFGRGWARRVIGNEPGAQHYDIGVLDRATMLAGAVVDIPAPPKLPDSSNARTKDEVLAPASQAKENAGGLMAAVSSTAGAVGTVVAASRDVGPTMEYALAAVMVVGVVFLLWKAWRADA